MKRSIHEEFMAPHSNIAPITSNALTVPNYFVIKPSHKTLRDRGQWRPSFGVSGQWRPSSRSGQEGLFFGKSLVEKQRGFSRGQCCPQPI